MSRICVRDIMAARLPRQSLSRLPSRPPITSIFDPTAARKPHPETRSPRPWTIERREHQTVNQTNIERLNMSSLQLISHHLFASAIGRSDSGTESEMPCEPEVDAT